jgi:hypothetical protein
VVEKIGDIFEDVDSKNVAVVSVDIPRGGPTEGMTLTWRNSSLPTHSCPDAEITRLLAALTANKDGDLKRAVNDMLEPEFAGKRAWVEYKGSCKAVSPPVEPPTEQPPARGSDVKNTKPVVHLPIDQITGYFGKLLRFTVPEVCGGSSLAFELLVYHSFWITSFKCTSRESRQEPVRF